jgi:hypothetical protein
MNDNKEVIQLKSTSEAMAIEEKEKRIAEIKERLVQIQQEVLPGKCPIRFFEAESGRIDWKNPIIREPFNTWKDALKALMATSDPEIASEIFARGFAAVPGQNVATKANVVAQLFADAPPQDLTESKLILQANALYSQGMAYLNRAEQYDMISQCEFYIKNAMKLLRLHNETVETLCKYRRRGEQRVVVQHVNVEGQAIVNNGNMIAGGGVNKK